jgi:hypothetical protein
MRFHQFFNSVFFVSRRRGLDLGTWADLPKPHRGMGLLLCKVTK